MPSRLALQSPDFQIRRQISDDTNVVSNVSSIPLQHHDRKELRKSTINHRTLNDDDLISKTVARKIKRRHVHEIEAVVAIRAILTADAASIPSHHTNSPPPKEHHHSNVMSGIEILGAFAAGSQIAGSVWSVCSRMLDKPNDTKALALLKTDAQSLSLQLKIHELKVKDGALDACRYLRMQLDTIVADIGNLKGRSVYVKAATALKLYKPEFRERFEHVMNEFQVKMWLETRKSADEIDEKLKTMTNMMEELKVAAEPLESTTERESSCAQLREMIDKLSEDIKSHEKTAQLLQQAMAEHGLTDVISHIERSIRSDGDTTREKIEESKVVIVNRIDDCVHFNDSLTRIKSELLPNPSSLRWNDRTERGSNCRLWSLDNNSSELEAQPSAQYDGIALISNSLETVENVYGKRHIADDVDQHIQERKRQRGNDVSTFFGLAKRGNHFEELCEFIPPSMQEFFNRLPIDVRSELVRSSQRFGQESRYAFYDQIYRQKAITIPKIHLLEDMERAMLACNTEHLDVTLGFFVPHVIDFQTYLYKLQVNITA